MGWDIEYRMSLLWHWAIRRVEGLNSDQWLVLCAIAVVVGFLCLRGYGSRTGY